MYSMFKLFIILFFFISFKSFCCELLSKKDNSLGTWLGSDSKFSKSFKEGRCALDKVLTGISIEERRLIANLIAKSYSNEISRLDSLKTYNY